MLRLPICPITMNPSVVPNLGVVTGDATVVSSLAPGQPLLSASILVDTESGDIPVIAALSKVSAAGITRLTLNIPVHTGTLSMFIVK